MPIIVTADSSCDLPKHCLDPIPFELFPLTIIQNGVEYKDGVDISPEDIYQRVARGLPVPTTSAVNLSYYYERFSVLSTQYDAIIHINIRSGISSCHNHAITAAKNFPNVYVVDSQNISIGQGFLALEAKNMILEGKNPQEIASELRILANKIEFSFIIDQLTFLHKGGRYSSLSALGANLLKLKPSIAVNKTETLALDKKYRGTFEKVLPAFLKDHLSERHTIYPEKTMLITTGCPPEWEDLAIQEIEKIPDTA